MIIEVTDKHIAAGRKDDCYECPIALAVLDKLPESRVVVGASYIYITGTNYDLPWRAVEFIDRFDKNLRVDPFSFRLSIRLITEGKDNAKPHS